jgi:hypothetical protein
VAIALIIAIPYTGGMSLTLLIKYAIMIGALTAGAGAITGAALGTGALSGAISGFTIGAGLAFGAGAIATAQGAATAAANITAQTGIQAVAAGMPAGMGTASAVTMASTALAGNIIGNSKMPGTLAGDAATRDAFFMQAQTLNGLPDYEQMREGTFYQAMTSVVNDPNFTKSSANPTKGGCYWPTLEASAVGDPLDSDGDGNLTESVSCVQYWISKRIDDLRIMLDAIDLESIVRQFIQNDLKPFRDSLTYIKNSLNPETPFLAQIERLGIEYGLPGAIFLCPGLEPPCLTPRCGPTDCPPCEEPGPAFDERPLDGPDGPAVQFWHALESRGSQDVPFWIPGPDQRSLLDWYDAPCDPVRKTCPTPPAEFDSVDSVRYRLEQFLDQVAYYLIFDPITHTKYGVDTEPDWIRILADQIRQDAKDWFKPYYVADTSDPAYEASWYHQLDVFVNGDGPLVGMKDWVEQSEVLVNRLQRCKLAWDEFAPYVSCSYHKPPICQNNQPPFPPYEETKPPLYSFTWKIPEPPLRIWMHYPKLDDFMGPDPADRDLFPGPVCKIDTQRRTTLQNEVQRIRTVVNGLWAHIIRQHLQDTSPFAVPHDCDAACSDYVPNSMRLIRIDEVDVEKKAGKNVPPLPDDLHYRFTYTWKCRTCTEVIDPDTGAASCEAPCTEAEVPPVTTSRFSWCVTNFQLPGCLGAINTHIMRTSCGAGSGPGNPCPQVRDPILKTFDDELKKQTQGTKRPFATIDGDVDDEFRIMYEAVNLEVGFITTFRDAIKKFYLRVMDALDNNRQRVLPAEHGQLPYQYRTAGGGLGPLWDGRYTWQDSQGIHTAEVETGPFKIPSIQNKNYGNWLLGKTCLELTDYCDNATRKLTMNGTRNKEECRYNSPFRVSFAPSGDLQAKGRTWVRVKRTEPTNKDVGWWTWNPFSGKIEKRACAMFGPEDVEISATRKQSFMSLWPGTRSDVTGERCR